jgi:hypothetical protein
MARKTKEEIHQETQERDRQRKEREMSTYYESVLECIAFLQTAGCNFVMSNVKFTEQDSDGIKPPPGYFDISVPRDFITGTDEQTYRIFKGLTAEDPLFDRKMYHLYDMQNLISDYVLQEKLAKERQEAKQRALAKLTQEERKLLGIV